MNPLTPTETITLNFNVIFSPALNAYGYYNVDLSARVADHLVMTTAYQCYEPVRHSAIQIY